MKKYQFIFSIFTIAMLVVPGAQAGEVTSTFNDGTVLSETQMNEIKNAVNDNNSRVGAIESQTQNLVAGCPVGQSIRAIAADGTVTCEVDDSGSTDTLAGLSCSPDQVAKFDGNNWVCAEDADTISSGDITGVTAGTGLTGGGTTGDVTINVDSSTVQSRVSGVCPSGQSIQSIDSTGAVTCEIDDVKTSGVLGTTASSSINITSTTHTEIASLSITDPGVVNVALNAHFSVEITGFSSARLQAEIRNTSCTGTILGQSMWRPGNSDAATNTGLNAITISLTGFQSVVAPDSFVLCVRKFDASFPDALIFYRGFNLTYSN